MSSAIAKQARLRDKRWTLGAFLAQFGFQAALLLLVAVFAELSPAFLTVGNGLNILQQTSTIGIMALGETLVVLTAGIDVSVGSILGLGGMMAAFVVRDTGAGPLAAALVGTLSGLAAGLVNGIIIAKIRINPFIATLATLNAVRGLVYIASNQYNVNIPDGSSFFVLGRGHLFGVPNSVIIFFILFVGLWVLEKRTTIGRSIHSIGGNLSASYLCGLKVSSVSVLAYAISGACAGLAGVIITSQVGLAVPYQGTGYELQVLAAVAVGGVALAGGSGSVTLGALGSIFIGVLLDGMALINIPAIGQMVIQGLVIIAAVSLYGVARSRRQ